MIYGYARVSTRGQERDGNGLDAQIAVLKQAGCEKIYHDAYTGTKMDRPEFTKLIGMLKPGDRLVVAKLDRLARTVVGGADLIRKLMDEGVAIHVLNMGMLDNTPIGRASRLKSDKRIRKDPAKSIKQSTPFIRKSSRSNT